jgi:SAM-dependent methyltransferase
MSTVMTEVDHLSWLESQLIRNRFLPVPPREMIFCGDGDFRAIGAEFLGHFVRLGDLRATDRVLDIGCGIGRMAVPLTQFLSEGGSYTGIDIVADGIAWCQKSISPVYPAFQFRHLDLRHPLYNPNGEARADSVRIPLADHSYDFIFLVSVLTHVDEAVLLNYAQEIGRLLAPGGRCFTTSFLFNPPAREALRDGKGRLPFAANAEGPEFHADPETPMAAVGFDEDFFLEKFLRFQMKRHRPAVYGSWSGRPSTVFQDICIFE